MAISIGESILWEVREPIPSGSGGYDETIPAPFDAAAGEPIYFHVHNHGANEWSLIEIFIDHE